MTGSITQTIPFQCAWKEWRYKARSLIEQDISPERVMWSVEKETEKETPDSKIISTTITIPRALFLTLQTIIQANNPRKLQIIYTLLWNQVKGITPQPENPLNHEALQLKKDVESDTEILRQSLLFQAVDILGKPHYIGWSPFTSYCVAANHSYFSAQLRQGNWSIFSPNSAVHKIDDALLLQEAPFVFSGDAPSKEELEKTCEQIITAFSKKEEEFHSLSPNSHILSSHTESLPKAAEMPDKTYNDVLVNHTLKPLITQPLPQWEILKKQALSCQRCSLCQHAQQTVFGEGNTDTPLMLVGEQPGDQEDIQGRPFVGPAGDVLSKAIIHAGYTRDKIYLTNAVKHFKFKPTPHRRLHVTPNNEEILACSLWLEMEKALIKPKVILMLGGSAAKALLKKQVSVLKTRSTTLPISDSITGLVTVHPSYLLRIGDDKNRKREEYYKFVEDIKKSFHACLFFLIRKISLSKLRNRNLKRRLKTLGAFYSSHLLGQT